MDINPDIIKPVSFDQDLIGRKSINFDVIGEPFAKQRPRAARKGAFITIYTPKETKNYESRVAKAYTRIYNDQQLSGALTVKIEGTFSVPNSATKIKRKEMLEGTYPHIKKPDCDNMGKVCLDALNGIAYPDDAIINELYISKKYGKQAKVNITIIQNQEL